MDGIDKQPQPTEVRKAEEQLRGAIGKEFRLPDGPLTERSIQAVIDAIRKDKTTETYERIADYNVARFARERLRQDIEGSDKQSRLESGYRMTFYEYYPAILRDQLGTLALYVQKRKEYGMDGSAALAPLEKQAVMYANGLTELLHTRAIVGNYAVLLHQKEEGVLDAKEDLTHARQKLDELHTIARRAPNDPATPVPQAIAVSQIRESASDTALSKAANMLDRDISWMLSFSKGVPGVIQEGTSPIELLYRTLLTEGLAKNARARAGLSSRDVAKEKAGKEQATLIQRDIYEFLLSRGAGNLDDMKKATIHEAFGRKYEGSLFGTSTPVQPSHLKEYMDAEVTRKTGDFRQHFKLVLGEDGNGVLSIGLKEKVEKVWNERGRMIALRASESIAGAHALFTRQLPARTGRALADKLPGFIGRPIDQLLKGYGDNYRKEVMESIRRSLGLPDGFDPLDQKAWESLSPEQWKNVEEKMKSTATVIQSNEAVIRSRIDAMQSSLSLLEQLRAMKHPDELVGVEPDESLLPKKDAPLSPADLERCKGNDAAIVALYGRLFEDLQGNWRDYSQSMDSFLGQLEDVLNVHLDLARHWREAGDQLNRDFTLWLIAACGGVLYFTSKHFRSIVHLPVRLAWRGGKAAVRQTGRLVGRESAAAASAGGAAGAERAAAAARAASGMEKGVKTARTAEGAAELSKAPRWLRWGGRATVVGAFALEHYIGNLQEQEIERLKATQGDPAKIKRALNEMFAAHPDFHFEKGKYVYNKDPGIAFDPEAVGRTQEALVGVAEADRAVTQINKVLTLGMLFPPAAPYLLLTGGMLNLSNTADQDRARVLADFIKKCPKAVFNYVPLEILTGYSSGRIYEMLDSLQEKKRRRSDPDTLAGAVPERKGLREELSFVMLADELRRQAGALLTSPILLNEGSALSAYFTDRRRVPWAETVRAVEGDPSFAKKEAPEQLQEAARRLVQRTLSERVGTEFLAVKAQLLRDGREHTLSERERRTLTERCALLGRQFVCGRAMEELYENDVVGMRTRLAHAVEHRADPPTIPLIFSREAMEQPPRYELPAAAGQMEAFGSTLLIRAGAMEPVDRAGLPVYELRSGDETILFAFLGGRWMHRTPEYTIWTAAEERDLPAFNQHSDWQELSLLIGRLNHVTGDELKRFYAEKIQPLEGK